MNIWWCNAIRTQIEGVGGTNIWQVYIRDIIVNKIRFNYKVEQGVQTVKPNKV